MLSGEGAGGASKHQLGLGRVVWQRALDCMWPRFMWSSVYGASGIETGRDDAFATLLLALKNRRDHPGRRPPSADGGAAWIEQHCLPPVSETDRQRRTLLTRAHVLCLVFVSSPCVAMTSHSTVYVVTRVDTILLPAFRVCSAVHAVARAGTDEGFRNSFALLAERRAAARTGDGFQN